jgi:hypothetical protein
MLDYDEKQSSRSDQFKDVKEAKRVPVLFKINVKKDADI